MSTRVSVSGFQSLLRFFLHKFLLDSSCRVLSDEHQGFSVRVSVSGFQCQGFSHYYVFLHQFLLAKLATRVNPFSQ